MKAMITQYKKIVLLAIVAVAVNFNAVASEKCKPCAAAAAARLSAQAAAAAALNVGKSISREMELDAINVNDMVDACCAYCAEMDSLGCQGLNAARCNVCQAGLTKISIAEAAAALAAAAAVVNKRRELDTVPSADSSRAPREELVDPCGGCDNTDPNELNVCDLNCKLQTLFNCCVNTNQQVRCQGLAAERCCKKLSHKINDLADQSAECCADIKARIGGLCETALPINPCDFSIVDTVNNTDADVITWLKSLYVLLYQVYQCSCNPCIQ
jgi:hypothetical protein